jgi:chromosome segregation ATPase
MDTGDDGRWMTYEELAAARGIDRNSARRLASRLKWRRQRDNQQIVRIYVPSLRDAPDPRHRDTPADDPRAVSGAVGALEAAVAALRERSAADQAIIATLRDQADRAEKRADRAENRADQAEQASQELRARASELRDQVSSLQTQLATAEAEAKAVNDRAWATGELLAAAEQRAATERERADRLASSVAHERQDFLDAESRTRQELDGIRQQAEQGREAAAELHRQVEAAQIAQSEAEADAAELRQAEAERRGRGRWARLRQAWRGE